MTFDPLSILEARTKRVVPYSYKLSTGGQYGLDVSITGQMEIDQGNMSVWIPFADGNRRDGVGDLLEVGGIDCSRHRVNPIVLFDHGKQVTLPIGLSEDRQTKAYTVLIDPAVRSAKANTFFYQGTGIAGVERSKEYDHAVFCEQIFDLMVKGYIRAGSIGYQVVAARELSPDYETGTPKGLHLLKTLMLELSAVVLPANGDTVRKMLALPDICGKPVSPYLIKSLQPYANDTTVQVGFTDIKALRMKYRQKMQRPTDPETNERTRQALPGDTVIARDWIAYTGGSAGRAEVFARTGDRLVVVSNDGGLNIRVRRPDGQEMTTSYSKVKKPGRSAVKSQEAPAEGWHKNIKDLLALRKKYKSVRNSRRRLRKSSPGSSVLYVSSKDIAKVRESAEAKGVKFERIGVHGMGMDKVKLTGDDAVIDSVAKEYGRAKVKNLDSNMRSKSRSKWSSLPSIGQKVTHDRLPDLGEGKVVEIEDGWLSVKVEWSNGKVTHSAVENLSPAGMKSLNTKGVCKPGQTAANSGCTPATKKPGGTKKPSQTNVADDYRRASPRGLTPAEQQAVDRESTRSESGSNYEDLIGDYDPSAKTMKTKAAPTDDVMGMDPEAAGTTGFKNEDEPLGAQVLRRLHEDHSLLMQDYDSLMGPLENEKVKARLQKKLEDIESELTEFEGLFGDNYPDLPGLVGETSDKDLTEDEAEDIKDDIDDELADTEEKDMDTMDDAGVDADSSNDEEVPDLDEAIDGMEIDQKSLAAVRAKYLQKSPLDKWFAVFYQGGTSSTVYTGTVQRRSSMEAASYGSQKYGNKFRGVAGPFDSFQQASSARPEEGSDPRPVKSLTKGKKKSVCAECRDAGKESCDCAGATGEKIGPLAAATIGAVTGSIMKSERQQVKEASGFLGELSQEGSQLGDEGRMKSYHYHKTMEGIGALEEAHDDLEKTPPETDVPPAEFEPGVGANKKGYHDTGPGPQALPGEGGSPVTCPGCGNNYESHFPTAMQQCPKCGVVFKPKQKSVDFDSYEERMETEHKAVYQRGAGPPYKVENRSGDWYVIDRAGNQVEGPVDEEDAQAALSEISTMYKKEVVVGVGAKGLSYDHPEVRAIQERIRQLEEQGVPYDDPRIQKLQDRIRKLEEKPQPTEKQRRKAAPGTDEWAEEEANEPEHKSHRKMCKDASAFFGDLSRTPDEQFGDEHRKKAAYWHSSLDPIGNEPDETDEEEKTDEVVGEMGEKKQPKNRLKELFAKQQKDIDQLTKTLEKLNNVLV